ncbi:MAG TPA: class I SAM-dependent methyltransferase [Lacipirellulaceae bacterium]|nr:class I SAM-dependent methyltransferase [Lacipirellulaceae bacterium]
MLPRVLEQELMDTAEDAHEYDTMDHSIVNVQFVRDLLCVAQDWFPKRPVRRDNRLVEILDVGAGTAQIPIELARRATNVHVTAVDAAKGMLIVARSNVAAAKLVDRIQLVLADAKRLPLESGSFPIVISNSIVHHIAEPQTVLAEAIRVLAVGGLLFHRDLARPANEVELQQLVETYAGDANSYQRKLFADSLRAALTLEEMRELVAGFGYSRDTVQLTSDRHWTWAAMQN